MVESETRPSHAGRGETAADALGGRPVHVWFEQQAVQAPDAVALRFDGGEASYALLNARANRLAHRLRRLGVGRGSLVGLGMGRSPDMIAGLLAILKAGGAYVPLDPDYPDERLAFMLRDTAAPAILADGPTASRIATIAGRAEVLCLDRDASAIEGEDAANPEAGATADDLAYVMYTSGSTGTPKGVMIAHRAVVRLVRDADYCRFGPGEVFLQLAPISFDASTFEIWGPLLNGSTLAIMPPGPPALTDIGAAIRRHGVTTLWLTSGLFNLMVEQRAEDLRPLRQFLAGGDVLSPPHVREALDAMDDGVVINGYGPTETTTFACCHRMAKGDRLGPNIPIGRPIANTTVRLLDEGLRDVPPGEPGEIVIGGPGVARGYLNHPDLTRETFIPDPSSDRPGSRLYRTGDRARLLPDGNLEFLGRIDDQVKLLGRRVEPGEVEAALRRHPDVRQAAVVAVADDRGEKRLAAYVVGTAGGDLDVARLRRDLSGRLPAHLIPSSFVRLDALPLTTNGKVDRLALPAPDRPPDRGAVPSPPASDLERAISATWERVLNGRVGPDDNFFDLGGDSLGLIEVHSELQKRARPRAVDHGPLRIHDRPIARRPPGRDLGAGDGDGIFSGRGPGAEAEGSDRATEPRDEAPRMSDARADRALDGVAIIGMAGRFPGAGSVADFWRNIRDGVESIAHFRVENLEVPDAASRASNPDYVRARGTIEGADLFDAAFFGILPREADLIDPQQRVFLECCWEAFEDAGYDPHAYPGSVAVYAGSSANTYFLRNLCVDPRFIEEYTAAYQVGHYPTLLGTNPDFLATRVSYKLNLRGPSFTIQCGCSTSLVAVCQACQALVGYQADMALAGGVSITFPQRRGYLYQDGGMVSPDGHCRTFDAESRGTVFGGGSAVVLLKRLEDAVADGDHVHAVIKGFAVNNDGSVQGRLHRARTGGPGGGRRDGPRRGGGASRVDLLCRGPRDRHPARRPHRGRRPDPRLPVEDEGGGLLRPRHGQDERGAPGRRRRRDRPDQRVPGALARATAPRDPLPVPEPSARPGREPVLREHPPLALGSRRHAPAGRGERVRRGGHERPRGRRGGAPGDAVRPPTGRPPDRPVRPDGRRA